MAFLAILVALMVLVSAIRNTQGDLFSALAQDVPAFGIWAAAIFALAMIGFVPGLKPVSRGLLALVLLVIVLRNYSAILSSFQGLAKGSSSSSSGGSGSSLGSALNQALSATGSPVSGLIMPGENNAPEGDTVGVLNGIASGGGA